MWQKQQQFVMDASHELKTPLTVIKGNASILTDRIDGHQLKWLSNIDQEVQYMQTLIEDLLLLAKLDNTMKEELFTSVKLSRIIEEITLKFEPMFYVEGMTISTDIDPDIEIEGIDSYIRRLCTIFLDNAKKYSYEGTKVFVSLKRKGMECVMTIGNSGDILSKDDISKIFNRFYMVDQSRKRNSHGLGLAIAYEIIKIHKAKVVVKSNEKTGNQFIVTFDII
jgi:signal transduction histidine kinase